MQSLNPYTGKLIKEYTNLDFASVKAKLTALQFAFLEWQKIPIEKRIATIKNIAKLLETSKAEYAYIITSEMGKVKSQAIQEIEKCVLVCNYYAEHATEFLAAKLIKTEATKSYVVYNPLGIILGIMPWNFPFWQVFRFAIPTLLAGNVVMLKHASCVPGSALAIESIFTAASEDLDLEIFTTALIDSKEIAKVIAEPLVRAVTLTGSVEAGKSVASLAGSHIKKTVLELGGSDPYIVLADANVAQAAKECAKARLNNCGQTCIAAKRFIVIAEVYDEFLQLVTNYFAELKIGDPMQDGIDIGPLANKQILDSVTMQVEKSISAGATCHYVSAKHEGNGYFYPPTILTNIPKNAPAASEEIFGPVACIFKVTSIQEAIELANDTIFGLGAAIYSQDTTQAMQLAEHHINAGNVFVNSTVASDPRLPFGGVKQSGYGRELSEFGIHEFVNIKTINVK